MPLIWIQNSELTYIRFVVLRYLNRDWKVYYENSMTDTDLKKTCVESIMHEHIIVRYIAAFWKAWWMTSLLSFRWAGFATVRILEFNQWSHKEIKSG